jgi:hypothetical protein
MTKWRGEFFPRAEKPQAACEDFDGPFMNGPYPIAFMIDDLESISWDSLEREVDCILLIIKHLHRTTFLPVIARIAATDPVNGKCT